MHRLVLAPILALVLCSAIARAQPAHDALRRALTHAAAGASTQAIGELELAVALDPMLANAWFNLGALLHSQGRDAEARAALEKVLRLPGSHAEAHNAFSLIFEQSGDHEGSAAASRRALAEKPGYTAARVNLAIALTALRRYTEALTEIDRAVQGEPTNAEAHFRRGRILERMERPAEAAASYRTAAQHNGALADAHYRYAKWLESSSRFTESAESYRRATRLDPENFTYGYALARVLRRAGKAAEFDAETARIKALMDARKRLDAAKDSNRAGVFHASRNELDLAAESFRHASEQDPSMPDAPYNLGGVLRKQGKTAEAVEAFRRAVSLRPDFADAHQELAAALEENGRTSEALEQWEAFIRLRPGHVEARYHAAELCGAAQDHACVARHLRQATALDSGNPGAFFNLGAALAAQRDFAAARTAFERVLALQPDSAEARAAIAALQ